MTTLGLDIGGSKFTLAAFAGDQMTRRETHATNAEGGRAWMLDQVQQIVREWQKDLRFDHCGIGFGGPVVYWKQRIALSTHVGGWQDFELPEWLSELAQAPAVMDNDANCGALGEWQFGAGRGMSPLLYLTISTGIGGGILVDGQVLRGADSWAGELGHINIEPDGPACLCGSNGCLERLCCGLWLQRDTGRPASELFLDPEFVGRYVTHLARGLKAAVMLLNPERIVIGGGISKAGDRLFVPLRQELRRQVPAWSGARLDVQPAQLGDDSVLWGALALARRQQTTA